MKKALMRPSIRVYNRLVRRLAVQELSQYGIDNPRVNAKMARWIRDFRRVYPYGSFPWEDVPKATLALCEQEVKKCG